MGIRNFYKSYLLGSQCRKIGRHQNIKIIKGIFCGVFQYGSHCHSGGHGVIFICGQGNRNAGLNQK